MGNGPSFPCNSRELKANEYPPPITDHKSFNERIPINDPAIKTYVPGHCDFGSNRIAALIEVFTLPGTRFGHQSYSVNGSDMKPPIASDAVVVGDIHVTESALNAFKAESGNFKSCSMRLRNGPFVNNVIKIRPGTMVNSNYLYSGISVMSFPNREVAIGAMLPVPPRNPNPSFDPVMITKFDLASLNARILLHHFPK